MDPKHLMQLAVIFDKGSITAAAKHLLIAQPTLTRNMATLEMQAGTQLFQRSRYGVRSTPVGEAMAREGRAIERNLQMAEEQVSRFRIGLRQHLRVGAGPFIGLGLMPMLIERLLADNPRVSLSVLMTRPQIALDQLLDGELDLVVAPAAHSRPLPGITRILLAEDRLGVFCGPSHPLANGTAVSTKEFQAAEWLSMGMSSPYQREIIEMLTQGGVTGIRTRLVSLGEAYALITLLSHGKHLAVLPCLPVHLTRHLVTLVELPMVGKAEFQRPLYFWCKDELLDDPMVREFMDTARTSLADAMATAGKTATDGAVGVTRRKKRKPV